MSAEDLLNSLQQNGDYYLTIVSPDTCDWTLEEQPVKQSLKSLSLFNVKQQHPMSLALMRAYKMKKITLRQLRKTLEKIEFFHYAFNSITSQRSSGSISTHYSKYAIALSKAKNSDEVQIAINEMLEGLKRKKPSFNEFKAAFEDLTYTSKNTKSKNLIKYTLQKILGVSARGVAIDYSSMTIEHILPESTEGQDDLGQYIGSIGNLILVDQKTNGEELGSLAFHQKKMILQQKGYPLDEYISQQDIWEKEQIRARTEQLARIVFEEIVNL